MVKPLIETKIELPPSLTKLPPFPRVALQVLKTLSHEGSSVQDIEKLIATDAVFASSSLHCANSALFALPQRVLTLRHAIVVLGRDRMRCIVLTTALQSFVKAPLGSKIFRDWWRHSLATAVLSEALAKSSNSACPGAYMGGLLHDVGRLCLIMHVKRETWRSFVSMAGTDSRAGNSILELEREILGVDHCTLGEQMLTEWGIPEELVFAARHHHEPEMAVRREEAMFVAAACQLASHVGFASLKYPHSHSLDALMTLLPAETAMLLESDPEKLREALETKLQSLDAK